jgi:glutamine amidotransferase
MLAVVEIGVSNLRSVLNALQRVGVAPTVTGAAADIARADAIVLPGVGAFGAAMDALRAKGLVEPLRAAAGAGKPVLGICLGMQLLAESSEEHGAHAGLGLIPGRVVRLEPSPGYRVPNIGWYPTHAAGGETPFARLGADAHFYYVHSYHFACASPADVAATIDYGGRPLAAAVRRGSVFGVQFHPEKSQDAGLDLLAAYFAHTRQ